MIIVLTHSDASIDSRILKHLSVASKLTESIAIGISDKKNISEDVVLYSLITKTIATMLVRVGKPFGSFMHMVFWTEMNLRLLAGLVKRSPSVIVCNDWYVLPAAVIGKRVVGAKLLYDAHELESQTTGLSNLNGRLILWIESKSWNYIDSFVTVSKSIQDWYFNELGEKEGAVVLNSPEFHAAEENSETEGLRAKLGISESEFVFVYVGIIGVGRGTSRILETFIEQDVDASVVFLGWGDAVWESKVFDAQTTSSNVYFVPRVPHSQVVNFIKEADAGLCLIEDVSLSDKYALPNKLLEYAFAGLPVVSSNLPEIRRIVTDYGLGVCIGNDQNDVAEWISLIRECQSLEGHKRDLKELSWESQAEKIHCVLSSLL